MASLSVAALLAILMGTATFWAFRQIEVAAAARLHTSRLMIDANALLAELSDAENGQRGYLLTGDEAFLKPYFAVRYRIRGRLEELRPLTSLSASQEHLDRLAPLVDARMVDLSQAIELRSNDKLAAAIVLVHSGVGKRLMESIRSEMNSFMLLEGGALARREAVLRSNMRQLSNVILATSLLTLLFALSFGYLIYRGTQQRLRDVALAELMNAKSAAEKANHAKSEFLSSMSHELRTPLHAILGFAQLVESGSSPLTLAQKASIDQILQAGWYLLKLINEVLDLEKIESGKLALSLEPVSLSEVLVECRAMIEPQSKRSGIRMSFPRFDVPCFVNADRTRLKQVLINLLSNAVKYNRHGGTVDVTCQPSSAGRIRIGVQDTGEGVPAEKINQLFQLFNRLGQETTIKEGTGIGLVVSKKLVELMGGEIGMDSTVGAGSVFWIEMNEANQPQLAAVDGAAPASGRMDIPANAAPRTLLYIEDNLTNMELVEQIIARRPDIELLGAEDGARGIALARSQRPTAILMDINLPGMSGTEALKILREDPVTAHIPVLAISANAMPRDIEKGLAAGFFRYLTKPINIGEFMEALDAVLAAAGTNIERSGMNKEEMAR